MESIRSSPSMMMIILMITIWSTIIVAKQHGWFLKWKEMSNQNLLEVNYREYHGVPESCNKSSSGSIFKLRKDYKQCHNQSVTKFSLTPENLVCMIINSSFGIFSIIFGEIFDFEWKDYIQN